MCENILAVLLIPFVPVLSTPLPTALSSHPVDDASGVQVSDATEDLVEQVGHPLMVQVHVDHLAQAGIHQLHHQIPGRGGGGGKGKKGTIIGIQKYSQRTQAEIRKSFS